MKVDLDRERGNDRVDSVSEGQKSDGQEVDEQQENKQQENKQNVKQDDIGKQLVKLFGIDNIQKMDMQKLINDNCEYIAHVLGKFMNYYWFIIGDMNCWQGIVDAMK